MMQIQEKQGFIQQKDVLNETIENEPKVSRTFSRVISSRLFWALAGTTTLTITSVVVLSGFSIIPFALVAAILGLSMMVPAIKNPKRFIYEISIIPTVVLNYFQQKKYPWSQQIIQGRLTLGAIPLKNKEHHQVLPKKGVTGILTMNEEFELHSSSIFSEPVTPEDWKKIDSVNHKHIDTPDFEPVSLEKINEAVEFMHNEIDEKGGHVYVHCKAGRGRSALVVICYLLKYGWKHHLYFNLVTEAIQYVKEIRPVINMNQRQRAAIVKFHENLKK